MDNEKDLNKANGAQNDSAEEIANSSKKASDKALSPQSEASQVLTNELAFALLDEEKPQPSYFSPLWLINHKIRNSAPKLVLGVQNARAKSKIKPSKILDWLFLLLLAVVVVLIGYYILFPARGNFHSDTTDTILWAQATLESGSIFSKDFNYACILPFGGHLIMLPFVAIFGVTMKAHSLGMLTFFFIFTISLLCMLKKIGMNLRWSCLTTAFTLLLVSGSPKLREIFWDHVIYYSLGLLFTFVGICLISTCIDKLKAGTEKKISFAIYAALLFLWCFLTGLNQIESLTIFLLPAFAAVVAERFFNTDRAKDAYNYFGNLIIGAVIIIGAALGYVVCAKIAKDIPAAYESAYSGFSNMDVWIDNFEAFYLHWTTLFGVDLKSGMHFISKEGIIGLIKVIVCIILVVAPIIAMFFYKKIKERKMRIMLLFHWFMTALIMMGFVLGLLASANWRLSPILCTSIICTFILAKILYDTCEIKRVAMIFVIPLVLAGAITAKDLADLAPDEGQDEGICRIAKNLEAFEEELGFSLDYGYATFWHANAITLLTDSEIPVRSISLTQNSYYIYDYQSAKSWYEDQEGAENYFVLLSPAEYNDVMSGNNALIDPANGFTGTSYLIAEGFYVLLYNQNIF